MDRLLRRSEAAEYLTISEPTLDKLRREGLLACVYVGPKNPRFLESTLQEYIRKNIVNGEEK